MLYDWRTLDKQPAEAFCFDAATGELVPLVFFCDSMSHRLGRYQLAADGKGVVVDQARRHPVEIWEVRRIRLAWGAELTPEGLATCHGNDCCEACRA